MKEKENERTEKTDLLFYGTLTSQIQSAYDIIDFLEPINQHQIRIIRQGASIHQLTEISKTQTEVIKNFSVFASDFNTKYNEFILVAKEDSINEKSTHDHIIPISKKTIQTKQIIFRGDYKSLTIAIYGQKLEFQKTPTV